ncbi:MAG: hypothetical protein FWH03_07530 [Firmicutes bacterium]|nr:hypothetical protein [Bacillota bacterium]
MNLSELCELTPAMPQDGLKGSKVYFGTGLASSKEESLGFGFEFLNMVLSALVLKQQLNADGILHDIATVGYNISCISRYNLIKEQLRILRIMTHNLNAQDFYTVKLSHCYHDCTVFKSILQNVRYQMRVFSDLTNFTKFGFYTTLQIAQMKYLYQTQNAVVKLGWTIGNKQVSDTLSKTAAAQLIQEGKLSEHYFDSLYRYIYPQDRLSFVYTAEGTDIVNGKRCAPYTVTKSQNRPLLTQPIAQYLQGIADSPQKRKTLRIYEKTIVHKWELLFGAIETSDLIGKLQYIQDKVLAY